ncbi:MAG: histidinol-phosphatase HisJ family protein [Huintestinicola sp.]
MTISDQHLHTSFSGDSETAPEMQIEKAIALGMKHICITDHHDHDVVSDMDFELDIPAYIKRMNELKELYSGKIDISVGIELGLQTHLADYLDELTNTVPLDFVIGSLHFIDGLDPYYPEYWTERNEEEAIRHYFEVYLDNIRRINCYDSLGHLDYIIRYSTAEKQSYSYSRYADCIDPILRHLAEKGKAMECNSGGFRSGMNAPNPSKEILSRFRELGGELITIGSDAHDPEYVGVDFERCRSILKESGFSYYAEFHDRKPRMIKL